MSVKHIIWSLMLVTAMVSCELFDTIKTDDDETTKPIGGELRVKFENDESSPFSISGIYTLNMGVAGELPEPNGQYGDNVLGDSISVAPGEHIFFTLDIPNLHFAYCQIAIEKDDTTIRLSDQVGYTNTSDGTFTHWGSHDRTVTATLDYRADIDRVVVWWSEWAGIEE